MKYHGKVGYVKTVCTAPGVYKEEIVEIPCYGDVTRNRTKWEQGVGVNDDINISNSFSLVLNAKLTECFMDLHYIEWLGTRWKISTVELAPPRLNIQVGGLYVEDTTPDDPGESPGDEGSLLSTP